MAPSQKIFGIGFQKTGTKSLHQALLALGYRSQHGILINRPRGGTRGGVQMELPITREKLLNVALPRVAEADAFCDNPWPVLFRELDAGFPNSKFILTVRDPQGWISSMVRHFGQRSSPMSAFLYGVPDPSENEQRCIDVFNDHNASVIQYFASRPSDLLVVDFEKGEGWEALCRFLGRPVPKKPFPHANSAEDRERKRRSKLIAMKNWLADTSARLLKR